MTDIRAAVVGNPNCGKTTLFNTMTGARQRVGNWPGVTVDRKEGSYRHRGTDVTLVDLPGVYSLGVASQASVDERLGRDYILSGEPDVVVNIVDASNLERNLYLTTQLIEMRVPLVVALNMMDVAADRGLQVDAAALAAGLGCPVVPIVASRGRGIDALMDAVDSVARDRRVPAVDLDYPGALDQAARRLADRIGTDSARWLALRLLEGDDLPAGLVDTPLRQAADAEVAAIEAATGDDADILIADARFGFAHALVGRAVRRTREASRTRSDRIDRVILNRALGIPIFLGVMYLTFLFTVNFASAFIDFFDILVGTILVDGTAHLLAGVGSPDWLTALLANGVGGGIQTVATFIPVIGFLFLFLSFLEDSGYMARAAFVMDRWMRAIGLPGKAFVPLLVGFGCSVPAVMATRTLDNRRDRLLTVMMAPYMSCGARLPVYALFAAAFFPIGGQNLVFALYVAGIGFAVLTGLVLKSTLLAGQAAPFVMELPPYRLPTLKGLLLRSWDRLRAFLLRAGRVIVAVVVVLSFLNSWGTDGSFGNEDTDQSVLAAIGKEITPVFAPMGLQEENWPAAVGLFTGIFAKEAVVGTLDALYGQLGGEGAGAEDAEGAGYDPWGGVVEAFATIPANLVDAAGSLADPLGLNIGDTSSIDVAAEEQEVGVGTFGAMVERFDGQVGALAYLLAILLYLPCVAAIAAIWRETNTGWTLFAALWSTGLAYGASVLAYQIGTFGRHPEASAAWVAVVIGVFCLVVLGMRAYARKGRLAPVPAAAE